MSGLPRINSRNWATMGGAGLGERAVVIGGSIAGLTAAWLLRDYFARVTIVERDELPAAPEFRQGAPQARHAHTLLPQGQQILEGHFPGLMDELLVGGAVSIDPLSEVAVFIGGDWHTPRRDVVDRRVSASRPLLERAIYQRVAGDPRVEIIQGREVRGLTVDGGGRRVTGVRLRRRGPAYRNELHVPADLVLDASGRSSQVPHWLARLGYTPPWETVVNAFAGYATRLYRRPAGFSESWKMLYVRPRPPEETRGGFILPLEGGRWHVSLIGMGGDYPPTEEADFLAFSRSLPTPRLYEAIKEAEPLEKAAAYRRTESRKLHYEALPRYLEGLLVFGDAALTMNPVYAQGMTAAALGSLALEEALRRQQVLGGINGLARAFQRRLDQALTRPWNMALREDRRWPGTQVVEREAQIETAEEPMVTRPIHVVPDLVAARAA